MPLADVLDLLQVGEPLPFHVLDPAERRLLAQGHVVVSDTQLEMLIARGAWVDAGLALTLRQQRQASSSAASAPSQRSLSLFDRWEQMVWELDQVLRHVLAGQPCHGEIEALADRLLARVGRHEDGALFVTVRPPEWRFALYALQHALHTATVLVVLSRQMGWTPAELRSLVLAALTMNVSTLELQAQMAQQPDPPTTRQRALIRAHPGESARLLRQAGVRNEAWLQAVQDHHERPDGSGYPLGLTAVGPWAHALRVADVFTAKISPRANRQSMPIQTAAKQLFQEEKGGPLAAGLIKALGLYPPGELVQLKSGEIAVVTHRGASATTPRVASITNSTGKPVADTTPRDTADPAHAITGVVTDRRHLPRIQPERVYGLVVDGAP
jgi:HD domain